ncbi:T9SS type A sorting domain-containing protein [candidate division KSB1 bacterium]|nr:T9SS type A sorting domain-containing protein [candidate division KSB1 bacterium]
MKIFKIIITSFFVFLYTTAIHSQVVIQGVITDLSNNPVEGALVEIINERNTSDAYTDYSLSNGSFTISISFVNIDKPEPELPHDYVMLRNYPNPFNPSTVIYFELPTALSAEITIFNILGKEIKSYPVQRFASGANQIVWDGTNNNGRYVAAGVYLCQLKTEKLTRVHKMILTDGGSGASTAIATRSIAKPATPKSNNFLFTFRASGESIRTLELNHLICSRDTTIIVQTPRENIVAIGAAGGSISLPNGFSVEFPSGAFASDITVTVSESPAFVFPDTLLDGLTPMGTAITINTGGLEPNAMAKLSFPLSTEALLYGDSSLAIYRWNDTTWSFAGGIVSNDTISTYVGEFSRFMAAGYHRGSKVYRLYDFQTQGLIDAAVFVESYQLKWPDWDIPIAAAYGVPVFAPIRAAHNYGWFPQGWYQFCAEWQVNYYPYEWRHRIIGDDAPNWTFSLNEYSSLEIPPRIFVSTDYSGSLEGPCLCNIVLVDSSGANFSIFGYWEGLIGWGFNFDWRTMHIAQDSWIVYIDGSENLVSPVVSWHLANQFAVLYGWDYGVDKGTPYTKLSWEFEDSDALYLSIYDSQVSEAAAIANDHAGVIVYLQRSGADDSTETITDIDGNAYNIIKIGDQWWMTENLKVTHYRNGDPIPNVAGASEWSNLSTGAYCNYDNTMDNTATYGSLYNWHAVNDSRNIAPAGWHVPTDDEWKQLEMYLGMSQSDADATGSRGSNEGSKMAGNAALWYDGNLENNAAFGESGLSMLPGGFRHYDNRNFGYMGTFAHFWSSTASGSDYAWTRHLHYTRPDVSRNGNDKRYGFSVRCVSN